MRLALLALAACAGRTAPPAIDWSRPPALAAPATFVPPRAEQLVLANGVRVIVVENHRLPVVAITALHTAAGGREDGSDAGFAALTADLLDEGAGTRTAGELAEALERAGARLDIYVASDYASMQVVTTGEHAAQTIDLLADMIRRPQFADADVQRVRARRVAELRDRRMRPRTVAAQLFDRIVFGSHPYAVPAEGTATALASVQPAFVRAFWQRTYRPDAMTLIVAGDVRRDALRGLVERAFGDWTNPPARPSHLTTTRTPIGQQLGYIDVPGADQCVVLIGREAAAAGDPHQLIADIANLIVGGGLGSRLDRKLHDELGVTLAASASFWRGRLAGTWTIAATFRTEATVDSIRAALGVIETARTTEVSAEELARAKRNLERGTTQAFDTMTGTARAFERLVVQDLPLTWYADLPAALAAIHAADVRAVAQAAWANLAIVVVGDWAKIGPGLSALGLPIAQYDRDGTRVK